MASYIPRLAWDKPVTIKKHGHYDHCVVCVAVTYVLQLFWVLSKNEVSNQVKITILVSEDDNCQCAGISKVAVKSHGKERLKRKTCCQLGTIFTSSVAFFHFLFLYLIAMDTLIIFVTYLVVILLSVVTAKQCIWLWSSRTWSFISLPTVSAGKLSTLMLTSSLLCH